VARYVSALADRRELLRRSQTLRGDNADSEGAGRLENTNPLGRATNESLPLHRGVRLPEVDESAKIRVQKGYERQTKSFFLLIILVVVAEGYCQEGGDSVLDGGEQNLHQYQK
jgi:hypothetical protein